MQLHQQISIVNAFRLHDCAECRHFRLAYDHALLSVGEGTKGGALVDLYRRRVRKTAAQMGYWRVAEPVRLGKVFY